jgi:hypothetical protein
MLCSFCCCRIEVPNAHYLKRCAIFPGSVHISCPVLALCCLSQSSLQNKKQSCVTEKNNIVHKKLGGSWI